MADEELDRNDAATPHKLNEARKRGQVPKSADMVAAIVFAAAAAYLSACGWEMLRTQFSFDHGMFLSISGRDGSTLAIWRLVDRAVHESVALLLPLFATILIAAIIGNLVQIGFVFSGHPLSPDWQRINPATGFKKLMSMRTLFDAGRACFKLLILSIVAVAALKALLPHLHQVPSHAALAFLAALVAAISALGLKLAMALLAIALMDFGYTRREFTKRMRMSRRELKDEVKHREGDPRIRARLRELRREMLKRSLSLQKTRDADLLITNPTHFAVALRYRHGEMEAPRLVGKGSGLMAAAMRGIAARHRVPVVQNRRLARALYSGVEIDRQVPVEFYADVARLMVWILTMREAKTEAIAPRKASS